MPSPAKAIAMFLALAVALVLFVMDRVCGMELGYGPIVLLLAMMLVAEIDRCAAPRRSPTL